MRELICFTLFNCFSFFYSLISNKHFTRRKKEKVHKKGKWDRGNDNGAGGKLRVQEEEEKEQEGGGPGGMGRNKGKGVVETKKYRRKDYDKKGTVQWNKGGNSNHGSSEGPTSKVEGFPIAKVGIST